jgi:hypothetical protein
MGSFRLTRTAVALIPLLALFARPADGRQATPTGEVETDSDPTRPVFVSVRPEFHNFDGRDTQLLIGRYDTALRRAVILRFELPAARTDNGLNATAGLGDAYGQFLLVPYKAGRLAVVAGSGVLLPTATDERLGGGKWMLAPLAAPLWRLARGLAYVKLQNFTSLGSDGNRPDVNYLLVTPTLIRAMGQDWWLLADTETKTNWRAGQQTGVKSGLQIGRRIDTGVALWVKPEVWWGAHRDGTWNVKVGVVWYQRRSPASR